uniref:D-amino-acid oxidase n=1 Tax=uncultured Nocardioidaceae bacterium TaxID=253824 RepID=A0A6J4L5L6_9ACTN|nr:MAG: D-amino-acid oxidase [uncultured Nocardioidaceae bacterium]
MRVLVVGAGVIGLTCAVRLAEDGHDVHVLARDLPQETTSAVAAAWWYPYRAMPQERVTAWAARTYEVLESMAADARAGVIMRDSVELHRQPAGDPWWRDAVPELTHGREGLPTGYVDAWCFRAPVVEMPTYLELLADRLEAAGGGLTRMALASLPVHSDAVVNCSGLGSRLLADDLGVHPVRGQVMRMEQVGLDRVWLAEGPVYVVPRSHDVVIGGSADVGAWDRRPDPALAERIRARVVELVPELARARVLGHRVALRPGRERVRLEVERRAGAAPVVHCYGHGGAGVTLSWGCADEVASLVNGVADAA